MTEPAVRLSLDELLADLAAEPAPRVELSPWELAELEWLGSDACWRLLLAQLAERVTPYGDR